MTMQVTYGFFGKLPNVGDFVSRGWSNVGRDGLDRLLQEALTELLTTSPDGKGAIERAPSLMLTIRPGMACDQGFVVAVLPSHDRVGRRFPLSAGVQWLEVGPGGSMAWPSAEYGKALIACVQRGIDTDCDPDRLCIEVATLGSPDKYRPTFDGLGDDETVPRLASEIKLLRVQGPLSAMPPSLAALCTALGDASDVLGFSLDARGDAQDFFVCRRLESGAPLASIFDGRWSERGWTSYGSGTAPGSTSVEPLPKIDDDATRPRHQAIDTFGPQADSLDNS